MTAAVLISHGARVRIDAPEDILELIVAIAKPFTSVGSGGETDTTLTVSIANEHRWAIESESGGRTTTEGPALVVADHALDHLHHLFATHARDALFVHAGVFEIDGSLVLVPGRSRSGKSTLVAAAVESGATYFSDEFAVIDADGLVHPYLRPMSLRRVGRPNEQVTAGDLDGRSATSPSRPSIVIATRFRESARWEPELVTGSRAALPLIDNTVCARSAPSETLQIAAIVARRAVTLLGDRGEASELLEKLTSRFSKGTIGG
jgi:hypothetical protein